MDLINLFNLLGTGFFAITGALAGIRQRMDVLGVIIMAFFVGLGGGTIRNLCLAVRPIWMSDVDYIWAVVVPALLTFIIMAHFKLKGKNYPFSKKTSAVAHHFLLVFDAFGLALFAISGTQMALNYHVGTVGSMLMGMITAIGGGIIRDLFCNEIPLVFRKELYATAALIGSGAYIELLQYTTAHSAELFAFGLVMLIRLTSVYFNWHAPRI